MIIVPIHIHVTGVKNQNHVMQEVAFMVVHGVNHVVPNLHHPKRKIPLVHHKQHVLIVVHRHDYVIGVKLIMPVML